jgi:hypothetical protein
MANSTPISRDDSIYGIINLVNDAPNILAISRLIRVSRIKLGCALDRLENFEPAPKALGQLNEHAENILGEIDALIESIQQVTNP